MYMYVNCPLPTLRFWDSTNATLANPLQYCHSKVEHAVMQVMGMYTYMYVHTYLSVIKVKHILI